MEIEKLRQIISQRGEIGAPELHSHFNALRDFENLPIEKVQETVSQLIEDLEEIEVNLQKQELQMRNKDKDTLYYQRLIAKTEKEIKECASEIQILKQELLEEQELKKQKAEFE